MKEKYYMMSIFIGAMLSVMITLNGMLALGVGNIQSVFIVHVVGLTTVLLIMFIRKIKWNSIKDVPKHLLFPGMIGVTMIIMNNLTMNKIGLSLTVATGIFGQMIFSSVVDHFGLFGNDVFKFSLDKIWGYLVIMIGIVTMVIL